MTLARNNVHSSSLLWLTRACRRADCWRCNSCAMMQLLRMTLRYNCSWEKNRPTLRVSFSFYRINLHACVACLILRRNCYLTAWQAWAHNWRTRTAYLCNLLYVQFTFLAWKCKLGSFVHELTKAVLFSYLIALHVLGYWSDKKENIMMLLYDAYYYCVHHCSRQMAIEVK